MFFIVFAVIDISLYQLLKKQNQTQKNEIISTEKEELVSKKNTASLLFVGDIGLGREINYQIIQNKNNSFPFLLVKDEISKADLAIANLEGPLIEDCPITRSGYKFCGRLDNGQGLAFAGFDLVSLANNHASNYGPTGISQTVETLKKLNIDCFFGEKIIYKKINETTFGFVGFDDIVRRLEREEVEKEIKLAEKSADLVVVNFHWGEEYQPNQNMRQISLAHWAIDAGADLVIGHHPHVVQPIEYYKEKPIFYSLGNFVFDQLWSNQTRKGMIVKITYQDLEVKEIETKENWINDKYQTEVIGN